MTARAFLTSMIFILALALALPPGAAAAVVGRLTQVEGRVDLLKDGKLPATPAKVEDSLQMGDVIRTKSLSRAQLTFMDNTVLTISPESRIAIEEYMYDPAKGKRSAVLQLFQGLAHVVVSKLFKVQEPDFLIKTHTAVMGVRGTEVGIRLAPNASTFLNFEGLTQVGNIFPEVGDAMFKRVSKIAFSFGRASVLLYAMQGTMVARGLPPTLPFQVSAEERKQFMGQMATGLTSRKGKDAGAGSQASKGGGSGGGSGSGSSSGSSGSDSSSTAGSGTASTGGTSGAGGGGGMESGGFTPSSLAFDNPLSTGTAATGGTGGTVDLAGTNLGGTGLSGAGQTVLNNTGLVVQNTGSSVSDTSGGGTGGSGGTGGGTSTPSPSTYTFQQTAYTMWQTTATGGGTGNTMASSGWADRTGSWPTGTFPEYYTSSSTGTRTVVQGALLGNATGTSYGTLSGTVTGVLGSNLTGTATYTGMNSYGESNSFSGNVVIDPSGQMTFTYSNGALSSSTRLLSASGTSTYVPGTYFTQNLDGSMSSTSNSTPTGTPGTPSYQSPYSVQTSASTWVGVSGSGPIAQGYYLYLSGTDKSPWPYYYRPNELGNVTSTLQGVVSPGPDGTQVGAMTIKDSNSDPPFVSALPVPPSPYLFPRTPWYSIDTPMVSSITVQPNGSVSGLLYMNDYQDGKFTSGVYNITTQTTPVTPTASAAYDFTQSYNGTMWLNPGGTSNTSTTGGQGWGLRTGSITDLATGTPLSTSIQGTLDGYFAAWKQGTWTATTGSPPTYYGSTVLSPTSPGISQMSGRVTGVLGQTLSGNMTFIGSLLNGTSFSYSGPVTMDNGGSVQFNYTGNWTAPGGASGTASGTMYQSPGYYFKQTMTGSYNLNSTSYNATLNLSGSGTTGSRFGIPGDPANPGVYPGNIGGFSGTFSLYDPTGSLPASSSGPTSISAEGVVTNSELGATFGAATYTLTAPFNVSIPGSIGITPGSSFFNTNGVFVQPVGAPSFNVNSGTLAQMPMYTFSETYQGFRLSTSTSLNLANIEGYGWGKLTSTTLPSSYTGYFVAQDLGTRASLTAINSNWLGVTGTMTGTLSGVAGQTLSGQMTFTGTTSSGTSFTYNGQASLAANGSLIFNYGGNWNNTTSGQTGTGSGLLQQVMGTYFSETASGNMQLSTSTSGSLNVGVVKDTATLSGTRTGLSPEPITTTASVAIGVSSPNPLPSGGSGSATVSLQGVVAGGAWDTRWGVASGSSPLTEATISGPVTIDTAGKLTAQFVDQSNNPSGPPDKISINVVSVPTGSGQTTSSFAQTASGTFDQAPVAGANGTQMVVTTPTPLIGTSTGTITGPINANLAITSTALQPSTYNNSVTGTITATTVGAVGGPAGGVQTGVASTQVVKTVGETTNTPGYVGTATLQPGAAGVPPVLTTTLNSVTNLAPNGSPTTQTGALTATPKP